MSISAYKIFLEKVFNHTRCFSLYDYGLMTDEGVKKVSQAYFCVLNTSNPLRRDNPCQVCEICRGRQVSWQYKRISKQTFSPQVHNYYSVVLALPRWPVGIPVIDGCNSLGELLFVTPRLFTPLKGIPLNTVLSGFRREGRNSIQDCFPGLKLGMFVGLHIVNGYLMFSPHLHVILCGTAIVESYWPLKMDVNGRFPELGHAWRAAIGDRGISARDVRKNLLIHWADRLSEYYVQILQQYKAGFVPPETFSTANIAFNTLTRMTVEDIEALKPIIRQAVISDPACVAVKPIEMDPVEKKVDPVKGYEYAVRYAVARPFKHTQFRDLGGGMVSVQFLKDGERKYIGDFPTLLRRMLQFCSVYRVRRYQPYGLFHPGMGRDKFAAFVKAMNQGYPRNKKVASVSEPEPSGDVRNEAR